MLLDAGPALEKKYVDEEGSQWEWSLRFYSLDPCPVYSLLPDNGCNVIGHLTFIVMASLLPETMSYLKLLATTDPPFLELPS